MGTRLVSLLGLIVPVSAAQAAEPIAAGGRIACQRSTTTSKINTFVQRKYKLSAGHFDFDYASVPTGRVDAVAVSPRLKLGETYLMVSDFPEGRSMVLVVEFDTAGRSLPANTSIALADGTSGTIWRSAPQPGNSLWWSKGHNSFKVDADKILNARAPEFTYMEDGKLIGRIVFLGGMRRELDAQFAQETKALDQLVAKSGAALPAGCTMEECFLTTAASLTIGLPDDCWELRTLRAMRDRMLDEGGACAAMVGDYYAIAPGIVRAIDARADARRVWTSTYWFGIVPTTLLCRVGLEALAIRTYRQMCARLQRVTAA